MKRIISALVISIAFMLLPTALANVLTLPSSLNTIDEEAFFGDKNLDKVVLSESITSIGARAFGNSGLKEVTLTRSITSIADDAFLGCGEFKVNVPYGCYAYAWCIKHGYIIKPDPTPAGYFTYETINGLYAKITGYNGSDSIVIIPEKIDDYIIQKISDNAFKDNTDIEIVFVPDTVIEIGNSVFQNCTSLISVDVGNSVVSIGSDAFRNCISLFRVELPDSVTTTGSGLFRGCINLESFSFPANWNKAGTKTIDGCPKFAKFIIPDGALNIPDNAFAYCDCIAEVIFSSSVQSVGVDAFRECRIKKIIIPGTMKSISGFRDCISLTDVVLGEGIETIDNNAFYGCVHLKKITIPEGTLSIGESVFDGCSALQEVSLPSTLTGIGKWAFNNCTALIKVNIPDSVESIGHRAFYNCVELTEFHYPKNLTSASDEIFGNCKKISKIVVPEGVTVLPQEVFDSATYLKEVSLPTSLTGIGKWAFNNCTALIKVNIPDSVESIGHRAFYNCVELTEFHYPKNLTSASDEIFSGCKKISMIAVPEGVTVLPQEVFDSANYLKEVSLPTTLTGIGKWAFNNCTALTKVYLSYSVNNIGYRAFYNCSALTIWTEYGSYALQYAIDNSIPYYYLSMNGATYPMGIKYKGDNFDFYGFVRSNYNVTSLRATVYMASSNNSVLSVDLHPNATVCDLSELINSALAITTLDLGEYTYSISASTDLDTETFVISNFTIVPAPLRSNADGIFAPCGSISLGVPFDISGTVTANYTIEKAIVGVYNTGGTAIYSCTLTPNTNSVDISAASTALQFSQMTSGKYIFRVYLTGNGETIVAYESTFTILSKTKAADREAAFNAAFNNSSYNENAILRVAAVEMADAAYHEWASKKKLESFGFNFDEMETSFVWGVHGCPYTLGWKDIQNSNGTTSRLFAIVCTGTHIDVEWISNVTVIDNGNFHYGFNTAAQRVLNGFKKYLNKKQGDVDIADCKVLITGHSRGAAVANILAGYYLPQLGLKPYNIYAYTFACPAVYRGDIPDIPYIFNYNLGGDLVGRVPFEDWGYTRFGETIVYANGSNLYGISVIDKDTMDRFAETLGSLSSENQMRFFQTMKNASGLIDVSNPVFVAYFALRTVVKECAEAYKVGSFHYNQLGNDTETVINGIINTHQQSTYVKWISNM